MMIVNKNLGVWICKIGFWRVKWLNHFDGISRSSWFGMQKLKVEMAKKVAFFTATRTWSLPICNANHVKKFGGL